MGWGNDIIGIEPARSGGGEYMKYDVERCKAESKKDDMTTDDGESGEKNIKWGHE